MMLPSLGAGLLMVAAVTLFQEAEGCNRVPGKKPWVGKPRPQNYYKCGRCGIPIEVTLVAKNHLVDPKFEYNITLRNQPQRELINFLEIAAVTDKRFGFSASYHHQYGYFLTSLGDQGSGQTGNLSYYWIMSDITTLKSLTTGLSFHVPEHREMILFNLTSYGH